MSIFLERLRSLSPPGQLCTSFDEFFQLVISALDAQNQSIERLQRAAAAAATKAEVGEAVSKLHGELVKVGQALRSVEAEQVVQIDGRDVPVSDLVVAHQRCVHNATDSLR